MRALNQKESAMYCRQCGHSTRFKALQWRQALCEVTLDGQGHTSDYTIIEVDYDGEAPYGFSCVECGAKGSDIEASHGRHHG